MADGRFAILDPAAGISGDMLLGALVAAGAPPEWLRGLPARLGAPEVRVEIERVLRCGVQATKVDVVLPGGAREEPAEILPEENSSGQSHRQQSQSRDRHSRDARADHGHDHHSDQHGDSHDDYGHSHHGHNHPAHGHPATGDPRAEGNGHGSHAAHRHIGDLIATVQRAQMSPWVRERAIRAFQLLGEAEGRVHGVPAESVALHEVGAVDALVDIVGAIEGFEQLGITRIYNRPVGLGSGWVRAAHGVIPVPAPATALLLEGLEVGPNGPVTGEAVTPTGAVLLRVLSEGAPPARWRAESGGAWGAGGRDPAAYPNALRLIVARPVAEAGDVVVLSTDVDDLSPEYLDPLREALVGAGALDVQVWPTQMKKGRTGFRIEAVVGAGDADSVSNAFFRHSTTAGVRRQAAERLTLARREVQVKASDGSTVRVKVLDGPEGPRVKPEFDDVAALAQRTGRPAHEVARDLRDRAFRLVSAEGAARIQTPNKES